MEQVIHRSAGLPLGAYVNPAAMVRNLWSHRGLIRQLTRRDIQGRYREARLGLLWAVLTPLAMLVIYTFVFSVVFKAKWTGSAEEGRGEYALTMFCGMLLYNLFAEVVNRSPGMVVAVPNYVKRVVFPLEVFVISGLGTALFNMLIGYGVWLVGWILIIHKGFAWTVVLFPLVLLPVCLTAAGVGWLLASLGVFIRDVGHTVALVVQMLFFVTPIFYRIDQVPERFQWAMRINPLAHAVEDARRVLMHGQSIGWDWWLATLAGSSLLALLGYAFFMKSKRAFADVI